MKKTRLIIVAFTRNNSRTKRFTQWENHITLVPYFEVIDQQLFLNDLLALYRNTNKLNYTIGPIDYFGQNKEVKVSRVSISNELMELHTRLVQTVWMHALNFDKKFCLADYKPHITHNEAFNPSELDSGSIDTISVIKAFESSGEKEILAEIELNSFEKVSVNSIVTQLPQLGLSSKDVGHSDNSFRKLR